MGLDLRGTKLVQLMESHFNQATLDQVKGRAIRFQGHAHLPENERHVEIRNFISVPRKHGIFFKKRDTGTDEYLRMLASKKQKLLEEFNQALQEVGSK